MPAPLRVAPLLALIAAPAFAIGGLDDEAPTSTETTETCEAGTVWDEDSSTCVAIQDSNLQLDQDRLITTARELAYADRHDDAIAVLALSAQPNDTMVLTYLGFSHRRAGRMDLGLSYYDQALGADPDNILARAYLGMAYIQLDQPELAEEQLAEIRARGGEDSWPDRALSSAISAGSTRGYDY